MVYRLELTYSWSGFSCIFCSWSAILKYEKAEAALNIPALFLDCRESQTNNIVERIESDSKELDKILTSKISSSQNTCTFIQVGAHIARWGHLQGLEVLSWWNTTNQGRIGLPSWRYQPLQSFPSCVIGYQSFLFSMSLDRHALIVGGSNAHVRSLWLRRLSWVCESFRQEERTWSVAKLGREAESGIFWGWLASLREHVLLHLWGWIRGHRRGWDGRY